MLKDHVWPRAVGCAGSALVAVGGLGAGALPVGLPYLAGGHHARLGLVGVYSGLALLLLAWWWYGRVIRATDDPSCRTAWRTLALWVVPLLVAPPMFSRTLRWRRLAGLVAASCWAAAALVWLWWAEPRGWAAFAGSNAYVCLMLLLLVVVTQAGIFVRPVRHDAAKPNGGNRSMSPPAIETTALVKTFGSNRAVDGVDLSVPAGTVYGLLGPNGAGKTTVVRMLATLLRPDGGTARVFGHDVVREADAVRSRVSLTGQYASVDEDLTGTENLVLLARLLGYAKPAARDRAAQLLAAFGLTEAADRQVKKYSGGMRRRIDIGASILSTPDLLFLDEPTTGLDPRSRNQVWDIVRVVVANGTTVLLTTQYLDEADQLAGRIAVIDHGRVIAEGTPGELKSSIGAGTVHVRLRDAEQRPAAERVLAEELGTVVQRESDPVALTARADASGSDRGAAEQAARALARLAEAGIVVDDFALGQPSLDEVFLALTDRSAIPAVPADLATEEAVS